MMYRGIDGEMQIAFYLKDQEHGWMSNFYPSPIEIGGIKYATVENFYQSMKAVDDDMRDWIARAPKPYFAMRAGRLLRTHEFLPDWDELRVGIMRVGLTAKFTQNPELRTKLLETGDLPIHENSPTDVFWGVKGSDALGRLLADVRKELRIHGPY